MKKLLLSFSLIISFFANAQEPATTEGGISFEHGSWKETLAKAKKENKLVMLDGYTTWCGPCKWMVKNIFPLKDVAEFYNKNFISAKIDMEKGEGIEIAKKYGVQAYPTYLFVDGSGNLVHRLCGSMEAPAFIQGGKDAMNPETSLSALQKSFLADDKNAERALKYFTAAGAACMDAEKDVVKFLDSQKPESFLEKSNYSLILEFIKDYRHASFKYIVTNYKKFTDVYGKKEIDKKILDVYSMSLNTAIKSKDEKALADVQNAYRKEANAPAGWLDAFADVRKARVANDTGAYFKAVVHFTDNYLMSDAGKLNANAWEFYEKTNTVAYLLKAEAWAKKSVELDPAFYNNDTYAAVLFKLGKYTEAKNAAGKAIEMGKKDNADVKETEQLLEKINGKLKV